MATSRRCAGEAPAAPRQRDGGASVRALRGSQDFGKRGISWSPPTSPPERELTGLGHPVKPKLSPDVTLPYRYVCACAHKLRRLIRQLTRGVGLLGVQGHE